MNEKETTVRTLSRPMPEPAAMSAGASDQPMPWLTANGETELDKVWRFFGDVSVSAVDCPVLTKNMITALGELLRVLRMGSG